MQACDLEECLGDQNEYVQIQAHRRPDHIDRSPLAPQSKRVQRERRYGEYDQRNDAHDLRWPFLCGVAAINNVGIGAVADAYRFELSPVGTTQIFGVPELLVLQRER
jgi:hypothetical protein